MTGLTHRHLLGLVIVIGIAALAGVALLWPGERDLVEANPAQTTELVNATLIEVDEVATADQPGISPNAVTVRVVATIDVTSETVTFETTDDTGDLYRAGQKVRLAVISQDGMEPTYFISDFRRSTPLIVLTALFVTAVVAFGRWQGVRALLGLAFTFLVIVGFIIPAVLDGSSPLTVAVIGALLIMIATLYLSHGLSAKTTAAVVGTSAALLITGALAVLFVGLANITGFSSEEARLANVEVGGLSLRGLLLAGIVIGGLGVLDDVTMSQASTVFELRRANPAAGFAKLVRGALSVGRDHIAATVNTLFLAYAGASLPLLILFFGAPDPFGTVLTSETVAVEIIRTLVGSVGLIAAVPLTTAMAAALALDDSSKAERPRGGARQNPQATAGFEESIINTADVTQDEDTEADAEWEAKLRRAYRLPQPDDN